MIVFLKKLFARCMIAYLQSRRDAKVAIEIARYEVEIASLQHELKEIDDAIAHIESIRNVLNSFIVKS